MSLIEIVLAGEPAAKGRVRFVKATGNTFTPQKTVNYESQLAWAAQSVMRGRGLLEGPLVVNVAVFMSIPKSRSKKFKTAALAGAERPTKKPDADNFAKMLDALNQVVWVDDSQIVDLTVRKFYSDQPRMAITVRPTDIFS